MALPNAITDREYQKFVDAGVDKTAVRTSVAGLGAGGRHTVVTINQTTWTALPATALAGRNAIAIQNPSNQNVKLNFDNAASGFVGVLVYPGGGERQYDMAESVTIYGKSETSPVDILIEEIA